MSLLVTVLRKEVIDADHDVLAPEGGLDIPMSDLLRRRIDRLRLDVRIASDRSVIELFPDLQHCYELDGNVMFEGAKAVFVDSNGASTTEEFCVFAKIILGVKGAEETCGIVRMWPVITF